MIQPIIIGAGPAGLIAAMKLKRNGYNPIVLEKRSFPRFEIGESLLPACMEILDDLDLIDDLKSFRHQVKTGATFCREKDSCEFLFEDQYSNGWGWTWQVKREEFDQQLYQVALSRGINIILNADVVQIEKKDKLFVVQVHTNNLNKEFVSEFLFDASGYGRVLPRQFKLEADSELPNRGAVYTHITDTNRTIKNGENIFVHAFNNNRDWIWVIPFNDETASIGIVGDISTIEKYQSKDSFEDFFKSFNDLNGRFLNQEIVRPIESKKGYSVKASSLHGDGYVLCGNSTEFLDPIFSSGVTFAMISGSLAVDLFLKEQQDEIVDWQKEYDEYLERGLNVFKAFIKMWYEGTFQRIAFAKYVQPSIKSQICSVLAGYVWDESNPFITKQDKVLKNLLKVIEFGEQE